MVVQDIRVLLPKNAVLFDNPAFDLSIVGVTTSGGAVYDFDYMVRELMSESDMTAEQAVEYIDHEKLRALTYATSFGIPPTVMYSMEKDIVEAVTYSGQEH